MEKETIIIRFYSERDGKEFDLDIPLFISANELIIALKVTIDP